MGLHTLTAPVPIAIYAEDCAYAPPSTTLPTAVGAIALRTGTRLVLPDIGLLPLRDGGMDPGAVRLAHQSSTDIALTNRRDDLISSHQKSAASPLASTGRTRQTICRSRRSPLS